MDRLDATFPAGLLTGFLGPNGAGKTTTFRALLGLTRPEIGEIEVLGLQVGADTHRIVKRVGAVVEEPGLVKTLNATDNLRVAALMLGAGLDEISGLLDFVGLTEVAHRRVDGYSKGMRQRLALAMAMLGDPELFILDEPLDGLDPAGQVLLKAQLRQLVDERGKTVVVSSHDLADVEEIADHVIVIHQGCQVMAGSLSEVRGTVDVVRVEVQDPVDAASVLRSAGCEVEVMAGTLRVAAADGAELIRILAAAGIYPSAVIPEQATLESVFLRLTGESA